MQTERGARQILGRQGNRRALPRNPPPQIVAILPTRAIAAPCPYCTVVGLPRPPRGHPIILVAVASPDPRPTPSGVEILRHPMPSAPIVRSSVCRDRHPRPSLAFSRRGVSRPTAHALRRGNSAPSRAAAQKFRLKSFGLIGFCLSLQPQAVLQRPRPGICRAGCDK